VRLTSSQVAGLDDEVVADRAAAHLDPVEGGAGDPQLRREIELHLAARSVTSKVIVVVPVSRRVGADQSRARP
jgi:hypothetical protein